MSLNEYPKITIVTPNYNLGDYIERTILSVLDQNYPNLEYIIIDGGSTDNSMQVIEKYKDRLFYVESAKDKGMYDALNKGFAKSTGEIMGWINSDDMLHPGSLQKIANAFLKYPEVEWIQGFPTVFDSSDKVIYSRPAVADHFIFLLKEFRYTGEYIQQESTFWKRNLWEKAGGKISLDYKLAGDFELWMRFFSHSKMYCLNEYLGGFRLREDQLSSNQEGYIKEALHIVEQNLANLNLYARMYLFRLKLERKIRFWMKLPQSKRKVTYIAL